VLVAAAGLFVQSLWGLGRVDAGFNRQPMLIVTVAPGVVVISRTMAERFWPGADPIGRRVLVGGGKTSHEIIGIAQDIKINNLRETPQPYFYLCLYQRPSGDLTLIARVTGDERDAAPAVRDAIRTAEPRLPMAQMMTLRDHMRAATFQTRVLAILVGVMGAVGLLLAIVGLYGVVAYLVSRRAQEFGVRLALGARPADILRSVLKQGLAMALAGAAVGVVGALVAGRALAGVFYGVSSADPITLAASALVLLVVALVASYVPARRASRVDAVTVLKSE
jgi:hypothetical protein